MGQGWIKLHRKIRECDVIWDDKPFSRGQAWVDLLLMVNHEDKEVMFDGNFNLVKRGQKLTSIRKLSEQWGWSRTKTTKFLNELKKAEMLDIKSDTKKTLVTVINYDVYQVGDEEKEPQKSHRKATEKPQKDTNKNDKECIKNEKEIYKASDYFSKNEILESAFKDFSQMRTKIKKPLTDRAIQMLITSLEKLSTDPYVQADILDQSTYKCWQGVFALQKWFVSSRSKPVNTVATQQEQQEEEMTDEEWERYVQSDEWENN